MKYVVRTIVVLIALPILLRLLALVWPDDQLDAAARDILAQGVFTVAAENNLLEGHIYRTHDVNGLIALVNAKLELRALRVGGDAIADALAASSWPNPYNASGYGTYPDSELMPGRAASARCR